MKEIKKIGLVLLTVLAATAFTGITSAMAEPTALCSADEDPCAAANQLSSVHETSVGKAKFLTSVGTIECNVLFSGTISTRLANPLVISGGYTWTNCVLTSITCTLTEKSAPAETKVLRESHETAKITAYVAFYAVCPGVLDCTYILVGPVGTEKGPLLSVQANGEATQSESTLTKETGGFLCPKAAKLDITTTPLTAIYVSH